MKVGIMSMQRICNYGSFLQAYALKKEIEKLGHSVVFVDYHVGSPIYSTTYRKSDYIIGKCRKLIIELLSIFSSVLFFLPKSISRRAVAVKHYKKYLKKYLGVSTKKKYHPNIDVLIIGSDEVFNCLQHNIDVLYSKDLFGKGFQEIPVLSYAASFGNTTDNELQKCGLVEEIGKLLNNFKAISVRDWNSDHIVYELTGKHPAEHLDPVLIHDFKNEVIECCEVEPFLLLYAYSNRITVEESKKIYSFAKTKNLKIICLSGYQPFFKDYLEMDPFKVLGYFKKAAYVVTDTFHGTIMSIINHRQFATFIREGHGETYGNMEKLSDLLCKLGLQSHIVSELSLFEEILCLDIDYVVVDKNIKEERIRSTGYLQRCIEGIYE